MLTTTTKPYNPNKKQSLDTDWDKIDLSSFLYNINSINIDKNDICFTGNDYENATTSEIVAEIIRTINATHYNSLLGMKDIINYNNKILKITESSNKSIAICNKKIKYFEAKINRINFLMTKAAKFIPALPLMDYKTMEKAQHNLQTTSCNDLTFTEDDFKEHDITNNIKQPIFDLNSNNTNDTINIITMSAEMNNKIKSYNDETADINDHNIKPTQPPKQLHPQLNQPSQILPTHIPQFISHIKNPSAILRENNKPKKEPQLTSPTKLYDRINKPTQIQPKQLQPHPISTQNVQCSMAESINIEPIKHIDNTNEIINDIIIPTKLLRGTEISKNESQLKSSIKIQNIDDIHFKSSQDIKPNKMKKKSKNKNKKNNYNNKKRRKCRKPKPKPKPKPKTKPKPKLLKDKQKKIIFNIDENMLTMDQMNEMIQNYELTDDQYQDFMNLRISQRLGLSAYDYYEEIFGPITDEKIKEWSSVYHSN